MWRGLGGLAPSGYGRSRYHSRNLSGESVARAFFHEHQAESHGGFLIKRKCSRGTYGVSWCQDDLGLPW
jgi:hypothetical protein